MERIDKIRAIIVQIEVLKYVGIMRISTEEFSQFLKQKTAEIYSICMEILNEGNYIEISLMEKTINEYSESIGIDSDALL